MKTEPIQMSFCTAVVRYLFFGFNVLFFVAGLALIGIGGYFQSEFYRYDLNKFIEEVSIVLPMLVVFSGFALSLISFFGCCGAAKNSYHRLLYIYLFFVGLLFILEISCGVATYVYWDNIHEGLESGLTSLMNDYEKRSVAATFMGELENDFDCCGVNGPDDYISRNISLPSRCCNWPYNSPSYDECPAAGINQLGCANAFKSFLIRFTVLFSTIITVVFFIQVVAITTASFIVCAVRRGPGYQTLQS